MSQAEKEEFFDSLVDMLESGNTKFGLVEANEGGETSVFKYPFSHSYLGQDAEDPRIEFSNVVTWLNEGEISLEGNLYVLRRGEELDWLTVEYDGTGGGGGGYSVVESLNDIENPTEGMMATVEGYDEETAVQQAQFTDYSNYDGSTFVTLYRSSDDGWMKDIWFDGSEFRDDINNDGMWHSYNWEGQDVKLRAVRDENNPEDSYIQIVAGEGVYMTAGSYSEVVNTVVSEFQPARTYIRTDNGWYQYGRIITWNSIKDNTVAQAEALVAEVRLLVKTGVPIWFAPEGERNLWGLIPYSGDAGDWVNFEGPGMQYGLGRMVHLYLSGTKFDWNGFDSHGIRLDDGDIASIQNTVCMYVDPTGAMGHRSAEELYSEERQPYIAVKGCELDFSAEYGFGSMVYARKWNENDEWHYEFCLIVPTDTGVYKGIWSTTNIGDISDYTLDSWTSL